MSWIHLSFHRFSSYQNLIQARCLRRLLSQNIQPLEHKCHSFYYFFNFFILFSLIDQSFILFENVSIQNRASKQLVVELNNEMRIVAVPNTIHSDIFIGIYIVLKSCDVNSNSFFLMPKSLPLLNNSINKLRCSGQYANILSAAPQNNKFHMT